MLRAPRSSRATSRAAAGFTLLELVIVITLIAILAGALVPVITRPYIYERRSETIKEMAAIEEAILGRPELGDPGFLSTIGRPPLNADELLTNPGVAVIAAASSAGGIPRGWNGPYLRSSTNNPTADAWGTPYVIAWNSGNGRWSIRSYGPDRLDQYGGAGRPQDDLVFPAPGTDWESRGSLRVLILVGAGAAAQPIAAFNNIELKTVGIVGGVAGKETTATGTFSNGVVEFTNVAFGSHLLRVNIGGAWHERIVHHSRPVSAATVSLGAPSSAVPNCGAATHDWSGASLQTVCTAAPTLATTVGSTTVRIDAIGLFRAGSTRCGVVIQADGNPATAAPWTTTYFPAYTESAVYVPFSMTRYVNNLPAGNHTFRLLAGNTSGGSCWIRDAYMNVTVIP